MPLMPYKATGVSSFLSQAVRNKTIIDIIKKSYFMVKEIALQKY